MINRPPTRIELKLEDDLIDYEERLPVTKNRENLSSCQNSHSKTGEIHKNFYTYSADSNCISPNTNIKNQHFNHYYKNNQISEFIEEGDGEYNEEVYVSSNDKNNTENNDISMR